MTWYRAGTVAVTNGSAVVTGTGTDFIDNLQLGWAFQGPDGRAYEIATITSATSITLASNYLGATATGQGYAIQPTSSLAGDLATAVGALITSYGAVVTGIGAGLFPDGTAAAPGFRFAADQDTGIYRAGTNQLGLSVAGAVALLLSSTSLTAVGNVVTNGQIDLGTGGTGDRTANIDFHSDDTNTDYSLRVVRTAGVNGAGYVTHRGTGTLFLVAEGAASVTLATGGSSRLSVSSTGNVQPSADNAYSMGISSARFSVFYGGTSTISTSDGRDKTWRGDTATADHATSVPAGAQLSSSELAAAKAIASLIGIYQFNASIAEKGAADARLHTGVIAQAVITALTAQGLDPLRYGFVCHDTWAATPGHAATEAVYDEEGRLVTPAQPELTAIAAGDRYGIRYEELAMFLAAAQEQRLLALEAHLAA